MAGNIISLRRCFKFQDSRSNKFRTVEVYKNYLFVTYGKIGSAGSSTTYLLSNSYLALKEADRNINEKLKKGYVSVGDNDYPGSMTLENIVKSDNERVGNRSSDIKTEQSTAMSNTRDIVLE